MTKDAILDALTPGPSQPKTLHLADGSRLPVPHPDLLVFPGPRGPEVCVLFRPSGGFRVIGLEHIVSVDVPTAAEAAT